MSSTAYPSILILWLLLLQHCAFQLYGGENISQNPKPNCSYYN